MNLVEAYLLCSVLLDKVRVLVLVVLRVQLQRVLDLARVSRDLAPGGEPLRCPDDVVEHKLRRRLQLVFRVARVVDQVRVLFSYE